MSVGPQVKGVRRVVRLEHDPSGGFAPVVLFDRNDTLAIGKKKKTAKRYRPLEKIMRQVMSASEVTATDYLARHRRSSAKKKNGWLRDLSKNVSRARTK